MVSDQHVAALRAFLALQPDRTDELAERIDDIDGYGALVHAAFVTAVRRRFAPTRSLRDVIRFVAAARVELGKDDVVIDPRTAELMIRRALGEGIALSLEVEALIRAQTFLLYALVSDAAFDEAELDAFLREAYAFAEDMPR